MVEGGENALVEYWNGGGGVPADTPTLKSAEVKKCGFRSEKFYLVDCEESPLYRDG